MNKVPSVYKLGCFIHHGRRYHSALSRSFDYLGELLAERLLTEHPLDDRPNDALPLPIGGNEGTLKAEEMQSPDMPPQDMQSQEIQSRTTATSPSFPGGLKQAFLVIALMLAIFLVGLDMVQVDIWSSLC
jgi:hypothetical protein